MKGPYSHPSTKGLYGIFNDSFPPILDGVTLTVENYARWLAEKGKIPCVVTPWNPVPPQCSYDVMRFFSLPIQSRKPYRYGYPKLDPFIWKRLRDTDFRLLHSHCPFSSGRLAVYVKKHRNLPLIGTFHSKYRSDLKHSFRRAPWCIPIIMKRILNFFNACDHVWIPQKQVEETVREYGYEGPLTVVENGNDFASIITGDVWNYKMEAKRRLGMNSSEVALLFVGQHIWEKGIRTILDALVLLDGKLDFTMNFIGDGYAAAEMEEFLKRNRLDSRVRMRGVIRDRDTLSDYYAASDLFIFPSPYDNAPLVLREAAAMGTPGLLLDGSTASEVIVRDSNGFLSDNSPQSFADSIRWIHNNPTLLRDVSLRARATLVRSWEDVVDEVSGRYDKILKDYK